MVIRIYVKSMSISISAIRYKCPGAMTKLNTQVLLYRGRNKTCGRTFEEHQGPALNNTRIYIDYLVKPFLRSY